MGNPYEELANHTQQAINEKGLQAGYETFLNEINRKMYALSPDDKMKEWSNYRKALEDSGVLPALGAELLILRGAALDKADGTADGVIHRSSLDGYGSKGPNPIYNALEQEAVKQFDIAKSLQKDDDVVSAWELKGLGDRQTKLSKLETFAPWLAQQVVDPMKKYATDAEKQGDFMADRAKKAEDRLELGIFGRCGMETQKEDVQTWEKVRAEMEKRDPDIIGKLSMAWLNNNIKSIVGHDMTKDTTIGYHDLDRYTTSWSPMTRDFAKYIQSNFGTIAGYWGHEQFDAQKKAQPSKDIGNVNNWDGFETPNVESAKISQTDMRIFQETKLYKDYRD